MKSLHLKRAGLFLGLSHLLLLSSAICQWTDTLQTAEDRLMCLFGKISPLQSFDANDQVADSVAMAMEKLLIQPQSFDYPFEHLAMGKVMSDDRKIRIYTWNIPAELGRTRYYGLVQYRAAKNEAPRVFRLTDSRQEIADPLHVQLKPSNWYGCLIYKIVDTRDKDNTYYTLLGYNPGSLLSNQKVIDLLSFDTLQEPCFGKPVFYYRDQLQYRILFDYAIRASMTLLWDESLKMIVFDHLSPSKPSYTGNYQFYGPDLSYDGLRFEKGIWKLMEDIDIRNHPDD